MFCLCFQIFYILEPISLSDYLNTLKQNASTKKYDDSVDNNPVTLSSTEYTNSSSYMDDEPREPHPMERKFQKKVKKRKLLCPLCGNYVRTLTPAFAKNISKHSSLFFSYKFEGSIRSRLRDVKHALIHSSDVNETRNLMMFYRQYNKKLVKKRLANL